MLRRAAAFAVAAGLLCAAPARGDYRAVSREPADDEIALTGDEVLVGSSVDDVTTLTAFPVTGGPGRELLRLDGENHFAEEVEASRQAVAMTPRAAAADPRTEAMDGALALVHRRALGPRVTAFPPLGSVTSPRSG